jgi:ubiquinone/menaquinone biosynthesis C-methylase UbiE
MMIEFAKRLYQRLKGIDWIRKKVNLFRDPDISLQQLDSIFGHFKDSVDNTHELIRGLRDKIKPGWQAMLKQEPDFSLPSKNIVASRIRDSRNAVNSLKKVLSIFGFCIKGKNALEIGCHDGFSTFALAEAGIVNIVGSDICRYYIDQSVSGERSKQRKNQVDSHLESLRNQSKEAFSSISNLKKNISFVEDDITASNLPSESFDLVCSWETLEHITDIKSAFKHIHRILKPGGIAFYEYNPFFSINGGHSLCTLDFLWGHARLNEDDFVRYLKQFRQNEVDVAYRFYKNNLNRMTIMDLNKFAEDANLITRTIIPWTKKSHWELLSMDCLKQCSLIYHTVSDIDLISPTVWVVHEKSK